MDLVKNNNIYRRIFMVITVLTVMYILYSIVFFDNKLTINNYLNHWSLKYITTLSSDSINKYNHEITPSSFGIINVQPMLQLVIIKSYVLIRQLALVIFSYLATVSDIQYKIVKNKLIRNMLIFRMVISILLWWILPKCMMNDLIFSGLGFLVASALFGTVYLVTKQGLGGADVKFMSVASLYIGYANALSAVLYASILVALTAGILIVAKKMDKKDSLPFIPFLYIGILINMFVG